MSTRFNRNDANVPDDRLFPDDFITDQNGQDEDLLWLAKDFGCLPCIGSGLVVTEYDKNNSEVQISVGWAYDTDGHRISVGEAQIEELTNTSGGDNYIILEHQYVTDTSRPAHRTGASYDTRKKDSHKFTVQSDTPDPSDIVLANCTQSAPGEDILIDTSCRCKRSCKLVSQDKVPGVEQEGEGEPGGAGEPPPGGSQNELPDLPKGRNIPMPIILGIETVMPEELGRTDAAVNAMTLERVNLRSGTPLADLRVWIGDWGTGQRAGGTGEDEYICNFTMPTKSGLDEWEDDIWITDPPGYYYLVRKDESWSSKIVDSGSNWVKCADKLPDADSHEFYICPYAEKYRVEAVPYETDSVLDVTYARPDVYWPNPESPTKPVLMIKELNLGGKYRIKVASMISSDNFTKWAEEDFVVGSDLLLCWQPAALYVTATPVDGGIEIVIPGPIAETALPEAYEICYTYGLDVTAVPEPDFDNPEHSTIRVKDRIIKLDVPPGYKVRVKARAINRRMIMRCEEADIILTTEDSHITAGGVSIRRNRKQYTGMIDEAGIVSMGTALADEVPLANPVWPEKIFLFNPDDTNTVTDIEVYVHGSNQTYTAGRKIEISASGDETEIGTKGSVEKAITDYRITDNAMKITVKNIDSSDPQDVTLRYGIQYHEDSESEMGK